MKYGIFGCSADPFTEAHAEIVKKVLTSKLVDRLIIAPTIVNYHRVGKSKWLDTKQKLDLINLFVSRYLDPGRTKIIIWDKDLRLRDKLGENSAIVKNHRFLYTLTDIISEYDNIDELYTIIGSDSLENFKTWWNYNEILERSKLIVINNRNDNYIESDIPFINLEIDKKFQNTSASSIREEYDHLNGYEEYFEYISRKYNPENQETLLTHTPIFDLVKLPPVENVGFQPVAIRSNDWVTIVVEKDRKFLMEKQLRYGLMKDCREFPCGMVEKNEEPAIAAKRELQEEIGLDVEIADLKYLGSFAANPAFMTNRMHYFYVNLDEVSYVIGQSHLDEHERLECYWDDKVHVGDSLLNNSDTSSLMAGCICLLKSHQII